MLYKSIHSLTVLWFLWCCIPLSAQTVPQKAAKANLPQTFLAEANNAFDPMLDHYWPAREGIDSTVLSPSGKFLLVTAFFPHSGELGQSRLQRNNLFLLSRDGKIKVLTRDTNGYYGIRWSSDEKWISFVSEEGVYTSIDPAVPAPPIPATVYATNLETGKRLRLFREKATQNHNEVMVMLEWLPNQKALLYASGNPKGLFLLKADGSSPLRLTEEAPERVSFHPAYALYHNEERHSLSMAELPGNPNLWMKPATWHNVKPFGPFLFPEILSHYAVSRDGKRIFVGMYANSDGTSEYLLVLEPKTKSAQVIGEIEGNAVFRESADGRSLFWVRKREGGRSATCLLDFTSIPSQPFQAIDWKHIPRAVPIPVK